MVQKIELLVHAGAPSRRKDDDRYKAQAEAYLAFIGSVVKVPDKPFHLDSDHTATNQQHGNMDPDISDHDETTIGDLGTTVFLDDTQLAYAALDSQLATSSLLIPAKSSFGALLRASQELPNSQLVYTDSRDRNELDGATQHFILDVMSSNRCKRKRTSNQGSVEAHDETQSNNESNRNQLHARATVASEKSPEATEASHSSYLKSPALDRPLKKAKANHDSRHNVGPLYVPFPDHNHVGVAYIGERQIPSTAPPGPENGSRSQGSIDGNQTTSELPTSYSLSDITSDSSKARQGISQRSASDPGPCIGSISPTALRAVPTTRKQHGERKQAASHGSTSESKNLNAIEKRADETRTGYEQPNPCNDASTTTSSSRVPNPAVQAQKDAVARPLGTNVNKRGFAQQQVTDLTIPNESALEALENLSTSIRPPEPKPSLEKHTTYVTERLHYLEADIGNSYRPASVSRDLRPLERGYWLVDCSSWSLALQISFWQFLQKFVGGGSAGWGVWCTRCDDESEHIPQQTSLGTVKVFCWGEVVKHVYLMLYVASKSQVRKLGLQWVDSGGEAVVQMRNG